MLAKEVARLAVQAQYAKPLEVGPAHRTAAYLADAVAGMTGGMIDLSEHYDRPTPVAAPTVVTFRDVPWEPFTAVDRCPNCDELGLHYLASPDVIPAHEPGELPADSPVVWRECCKTECGMVWAQLQ